MDDRLTKIRWYVATTFDTSDPQHKHTRHQERVPSLEGPLIKIYLRVTIVTTDMTSSKSIRVDCESRKWQSMFRKDYHTTPTKKWRCKADMTSSKSMLFDCESRKWQSMFRKGYHTTPTKKMMMLIKHDIIKVNAATKRQDRRTRKGRRIRQGRRKQVPYQNLLVCHHTVVTTS